MDHPLVAELKKQDDERRSRVQSVTTPQENPRDVLCDAAGRELLDWITQWKTSHKLTSIEYLWILQQVQAKHMRDMITTERAGVK